MSRRHLVALEEFISRRGKDVSSLFVRSSLERSAPVKIGRGQLPSCFFPLPLSKAPLSTRERSLPVNKAEPGSEKLVRQRSNLIIIPPPGRAPPLCGSLKLRQEDKGRSLRLLADVGSERVSVSPLVVSLGFRPESRAVDFRSFWELVWSRSRMSITCAGLGERKGLYTASLCYCTDPRCTPFLLITETLST